MEHQKIKLIIFDLDGVLIETKQLHFEALNLALEDKYKISWDTHVTKFDGLKTSKKLEILSADNGLPVADHKRIWQLKQKNTMTLMEESKFNPDIFRCISSLKDHGYKIACCSNSIRQSVHKVLEKLKIHNFFDLITSNEDVKNSKPHPEMYWNTMASLGVLPDETIIIEDSPIGLLAAQRSTANVIRVQSPQDTNFEFIINEINKITYKKIPNMKNKWKNDKLNVLIPMAGAGSRFEKAGYTFPKPLIDVLGKPMIQVVVDNLSVDANFIFIVQAEHRKKYNLDSLLNIIAPNCKIVEVNGITEGAACTTLLAKEYIDNNNPLLIANSDQFLEWDSSEFFYKMQESACDAGIVTFTSTHPKWSFVKLNNNLNVIQVAEKNPISDIATAGIYYWKHGSDYVKYAESMISKNIRVNNEFYVCPVFNEAVKDLSKITTFHINKMYGLGTPEDLNTFLSQK
ncbi:MAG: HAD-IA family hydrolase [Opitutae bacterium]